MTSCALSNQSGYARTFLPLYQQSSRGRTMWLAERYRFRGSSPIDKYRRRRLLVIMRSPVPSLRRVGAAPSVVFACLPLSLVD